MRRVASLLAAALTVGCGGGDERGEPVPAPLRPPVERLYESPDGGHRPAVAAPADGAAARLPIPVAELRLPPPRGPVLRVRLRSDGVAGEWIEWVAPRSQHCRREGEQVELATPTHRAVISPESWGPNAGAWVRIGSKAFVHGTLWPPCAALALAEDAAGEARLRWRGRQITAAVDERISADEATARALFALDESAIRSYDLERPLASAPPGMRAYWLGRSAAGRVAVRAVEHFDGFRPSAPARYLFVTYELPADADGGWSLPGNRSQPPGELQVVSQSIRENLARRTMRHFENAHRRHGWPRYRVALRNGEHAAVYPNLGEGVHPVIGFQVATERTLIGVSGRFELNEIPRLARLLRPLTGS